MAKGKVVPQRKSKAPRRARTLRKNPSYDTGSSSTQALSHKINNGETIAELQRDSTWKITIGHRRAADPLLSKQKRINMFTL